MVKKMAEFLENSIFFAVFAGIAFYLLGDFLRKKLRIGFLNPLLVSVALTIALIVCLDVDYGKYSEGAKYLSYLLTPATVSLAIPLYRQLNALRGNTAAVFAGILSGTAASLACIFAMSAIFGLTHEEYVTMLPKSITTAIGMGVSEELGGNVSLTAAAIITTGIFGNAAGELVLRLFRIKEPAAKGVALGTAAHAIGTSKAMQLGDTEGAVSSLSLVVSGIITVAGASVFAAFM